MPAKSKQQWKFIFAMRGKYGSKEKAPEDMKWVFDDKWTDTDYDELPTKVKQESIIWYKPLFELKVSRSEDAKKEEWKAWFNVTDPDSDSNRIFAIHHDHMWYFSEPYANEKVGFIKITVTEREIDLFMYNKFQTPKYMKILQKFLIGELGEEGFNQRKIIIDTF